MFFEPDPATQTRGSSVSTSTDHATLFREESSYRKMVSFGTKSDIWYCTSMQTYIRVLKQFQDLQIVSLGVC
jgi:phosphosulfolactate phosphohydrolase-like enzyme